MNETARHRFSLLVFDWDGTLFDSTALIARCIQDACRDMGVAVPDERAASQVIGLGLVDALSRVAPEVPPARYPELADCYRRHYFGQQGAITLFPGVVDMLHLLKEQRFTLAIATGKSRKGLDAALDSVQLKGLFDASRTADETAGKPNPLMLEELMRQFGVAPGHTLMIGDTTHDLQMAENAGASSVAVSYGAHQPAVLAEFGPRRGTLAHVSSVAALSAWLASHG